MTEAEVSLFLQEVIDAKRAALSVNQVVATIAWHFHTADKMDPTNTES